MNSFQDPHTQLVNGCLLEISKLPWVRVWKNHRGQAQTIRGQWMNFGIPGQADITGIVKNERTGHGIRTEIECKTGTGRQEPDQINFERMILKMGGQYRVAKSVDDAVKFVWTIRKL